jgi:hypothetical protein
MKVAKEQTTGTRIGCGVSECKNEAAGWKPFPKKSPHNHLALAVCRGHQKMAWKDIKGFDLNAQVKDI